MDDDRHDRDQQPQRRPRRWRLLLVLVLLAGGVWFAPWIVANTPLRQQIVPLVAPQIEGSVHIGRATLSWIKPAALTDVAVFDRDKAPLLEVPRLTSRKSLWAWGTDWQNLRHVRIERPHLHVTLREDGSNVEEFLRPLMTDDDAPLEVQGTIELVDATVEVTDQVGGEQWTLDQCNTKLTLGGDAALLTATAGGRIADGQQQSPVQLDVTIVSPEEGRVDVRTDSLPLAMVSRVAQRLAADVTLAGQLGGQVKCSWQGRGAERQIVVDSQLGVDRLQCTAAQLLGDDRLQMERLDASGKVTLAGQRLDLADVRVVSDLGRFEVTGSTTLSAWQQVDAARLSAALGDDCRLSGQVDLARLAQTLPGTLRLRRDAAIESGTLEVDLVGQLDQGARRWTGRLDAANLQAVVAGKQVAWDQPVSLHVQAVQSGGGLLLEQFACDSVFLQATAQGRPERGSLTARADLDRLAAELGQLVDLGAIRMSGKLAAQLEWQLDQQQLTAGGNVTVTQFELAAPDRQTWQETHLELIGQLQGSVAPHGLARIESARVQLTSGDDRLDAQLRQPINGPLLAVAWPLQLHVEGGLQSWQARLQSWAGPSSWRARGAIDVDATVVASAERVDVETSKTKIDALHVVGPGVDVREPMVELTTAGRWDAAAKRFTSADTTLASTTLAFRAADVDVQWGDALLASGDLNYRADLARLQAWQPTDGAPRDRQWAGQVVGRVKLALGDGGVQVQSVTQIENLALLSRTAGDWAPAWQEPQLEITAAGRYDPEQDRLDLEQLQLSSPALRVAMQGSVAQLRNQAELNLTGQSHYDLAAVVARLRPYLGESVQLAGQQQRTFSIRGPLFEPPSPPEAIPAAARRSPVDGLASSGVATGPLVPRTLTAEADLGWATANLYGVQVGQGELQARLADATVQVIPLELAVSEGAVTLAPQIDLTGPSPVLLLDQQTKIEQVRVSPEMCRSWLKFVAPLVADATAAEGRISLEVAGGRIPLDMPRQADLGGTLTVESVQVGPGPLAKEMIALAQEVQAIVERQPGRALAPGRLNQTWIQIDQQQVPFRVVQGRVYHQPLTMTVDNVAIRTHGSVGLDETLDLVVEVPVQDAWIQSEPLLAGLRGQSIQLPLRGTLRGPQIDRRALRDLAGRLVGNAAGQLLQGEVGRQLDRLFQGGAGGQ